MNLNVTSWLTETTFTPYPLTKSFGYDGFIVDASFVQFDNFVPTLKTIKVNDVSVDLTVSFDLYTVTFNLAISDIATVGYVARLTNNGRYLGRLVFGPGVVRLIDDVGNNTTINVNISFLAHTVKSIPSKCGVFAINQVFGDFRFLPSQFITFNEVHTSGDTVHNVTFNAVAYPQSDEEPYLKTLNGIGPTNNSVFIRSSDLIKVSGQASTVEISLVGTGLNESTKANAIIITSDDNA